MGCDNIMCLQQANIGVSVPGVLEFHPYYRILCLLVGYTQRRALPLHLHQLAYGNHYTL